MQFVHIPAAEHTIGWRHDDLLSEEAWQGVDHFMPRALFMSAFSVARTVSLPAFQIAATPLDAEELLEDLAEDDLDALETLEGLCHHLDAALRLRGLRLPTEDEFEAATDGTLFGWGATVPDGAPHNGLTRFTAHREATPRGLLLNHDPYIVEIVRSAFKMGDGGSAICGDYPWPVSWLSLSPSWRVPEDLADDLSVWLEGALVRPVKLSAG